ncbi:ABC transporter permease [Microbacterium nanhaiense]|uniref:ABC transporter permease n=1 Tax=Microbacterium nanhaiense TaxID=1301026 RepID=A0ABQ2N340_9MICO|nr:sugar ABC transporter permease [Microbacterium nanhaiense]GGO64927.1 ABC transporter permease [Microbacterium nanhaiense]
MTDLSTRTVVTGDASKRAQRRPVPQSRGAAVRQRRENIAAYTFLIPWLVGFFGLTVGPMLYTLYLSFTNYNLFSAPTWTGLDNYIRLFTNDPSFIQSAKITLFYVLVGTPLKLAVALGAAMLLNYRDTAATFFRSAFYVPSLIGASVSVAIVWRAMFVTDGPVDSALSFFGINLGGWVGNVDLVVPMMILLAVWGFGGTMIIFLAGLKNIPGELYEAADVDGAGPLRKFRNITLPMLSPVIFFNLLLETIGAFQVFGSAYIISAGTGGPAGMTNFYTLYLYKRAFTDTQMGYASAMAWVLLIVVAIVAVFIFRSSQSWVHYAGDEK